MILVSLVGIKQANLHADHRLILYVISFESYISEEKKDISVRCVCAPTRTPRFGQIVSPSQSPRSKMC